MDDPFLKTTPEKVELEAEGNEEIRYEIPRNGPDQSSRRFDLLRAVQCELWSGAAGKF